MQRSIDRLQAPLIKLCPDLISLNADLRRHPYTLVSPYGFVILSGKEIVNFWDGNSELKECSTAPYLVLVFKCMSRIFLNEMQMNKFLISLPI
jgi:hypothetical protein